MAILSTVPIGASKDVASLTGVTQCHVQQMAKYYEANRVGVDAASPDELRDFLRWIKAEQGHSTP